MERAFLDICSGRRRGAGASILRAAFSAAEIPYSALMLTRNWLYDRRLLPMRGLPRPAVSVGNITTGGTGKTPMVAWLTTALIAAGRHPAILLRGYKGTDEQIVLSAANPGCPVVANPDRAAGAAQALAGSGSIDVFVLDDAMQHRRVRRDMEIVLVNARQPWGFGHLLPRGLLREPLSGLRRADALVITHVAEIVPAGLKEIEAAIRRYNPQAPIFHADHVLTGLEPFDGSARLPMSALNGKKYFAACGIGAPESFISILAQHGGELAGKRFFADHHPFTEQDAAALRRDAETCGAAMIIVTQKDRAKLKDFAAAKSFFSTALEIRFAGLHGQQLLELVMQRTKP
jgi:tetraacyldisaccharide 4'-kinase